MEADVNKPFIALGSLPAIQEAYDLENSAIIPYIITGRDVEGKILPVIPMIRTGSLVRLKRGLYSDELKLGIEENNVYVFASLILSRA